MLRWIRSHPIPATLASTVVSAILIAGGSFTAAGLAFALCYPAIAVLEASGPTLTKVGGAAWRSVIQSRPVTWFGEPSLAVVLGWFALVLCVLLLPQGPLVLLLAALLLLALAAVTCGVQRVARGRRIVRLRKDRPVGTDPHAVSLAGELLLLWSVAVSWFAALTRVLWHHGILGLSHGPEPLMDLPALQAVHFYAWHLLDLFPVIDATKTARWSEPFTYHAPGAGALLLTYEAMVLLPIVALLRALWKSAQTGIAEA